MAFLRNYLTGQRWVDIIKNGINENTSYFNEKTLVPEKEDDFTNKVNDAYANLSEILESNF